MPSGHRAVPIAVALAALCAPAAAFAQAKPSGCAALPDHARLRAALVEVVKQGKDANSGMGNHYFPSQPGESLFSLATAAPPNPTAAYAGPPDRYGKPNDPLVGKPVGGIIVFGGGLALYDPDKKLLGALGVSGDTSCADHVVAWKVRHALGLDHVPAGVAKNATDNMILDIEPSGRSVSGFGHPTCKAGKPPEDIVKALPEKFAAGAGKKKK